MKVLDRIVPVVILSWKPGGTSLLYKTCGTPLGHAGHGKSHYVEARAEKAVALVKIARFFLCCGSPVCCIEVSGNLPEEAVPKICGSQTAQSLKCQYQNLNLIQYSTPAYTAQVEYVLTMLFLSGPTQLHSAPVEVSRAVSRIDQHKVSYSSPVWTWLLYELLWLGHIKTEMGPVASPGSTGRIPA